MPAAKPARLTKNNFFRFKQLVNWQVFIPAFFCFVMDAYLTEKYLK